MYPGVALGMPVGILRQIHQRRQLGEVIEPAAIAQKAQAERRPLAQQEQLAPFLEDALAGQAFESDGAAQLDRSRIDPQLETGRELGCAQHPQRVIAEGRRGVSQQTAAQIWQSLKRILDLVAQRVEVHRIDREVSPGSCFFHTHFRIGRDVESAMPPARLGFPARQGNIDGQSLELDHTEGPADQIQGENLAERGLQAIGRHPENLDVEIPRRQAEGRIANAAADQIRPPTFTAYRLADDCQRPADVGVVDTQVDIVVGGHGPPLVSCRDRLRRAGRVDRCRRAERFATMLARPGPAPKVELIA